MVGDHVVAAGKSGVGYAVSGSAVYVHCSNGTRAVSIDARRSNHRAVNGNGVSDGSPVIGGMRCGSPTTTAG